MKKRFTVTNSVPNAELAWTLRADEAAASLI
jgi:hypothetical protein